MIGLGSEFHRAPIHFKLHIFKNTEKLGLKTKYFLNTGSHFLVGFSHAFGFQTFCLRKTFSHVACIQMRH